MARLRRGLPSAARELLVTVARAELVRQPMADGADADLVTVLTGGSAGSPAFAVRPGAFATAAVGAGSLAIGPQQAAVDEAALRALVPGAGSVPDGTAV